ncbi:phage portal protein [Vibrio maritimus]|uniref:Phage portal protein n=1 Tax=Vibrio maritimus TaxID=990268 RepID=A0A090RTD8_9VIBR|nr:phage portal protein [Vibrio maritimus]
MLIHGNGYARVTRNGRGQIVSLWSLPAIQMTPYLDQDTTLRYLYKEPKPLGVQYDTVLNDSEVLHIRDMGNGLVGMSRIAYAASSFGIGSAQDDYTKGFFTGGGNPRSVVETDQLLTPEQREIFKTNLGSQMADTETRGGTVLLEAGFKYKQTQLSMSDMQTLAARKYQVEDIARWFGVPLMLMGMSETAKDRTDGVESAIRGWLMTDLGPLMTKIENALTVQLLTPAERRRFKVRFDITQILKHDVTTLMNIAEKGRRNGIMSINECRDMIHLPRKDGAQYDELAQQAQMVNVGANEDPANEK